MYNPNDQFSRTDLAVKLTCRLMECGFTRDKAFERGPEKIREHVYVREIKSNIYVVVYTSCSGHRGIISARNCGRDAIRVIALYRSSEGTKRGLSKHRRVNRTGTVDNIVDRTVQRARDAWRVGANPESCKDCGAPMFTSKKNNRVCAEACWTRSKRG